MQETPRPPGRNPKCITFSVIKCVSVTDPLPNWGIVKTLLVDVCIYQGWKQGFNSLREYFKLPCGGCAVSPDKDLQCYFPPPGQGDVKDKWEVVSVLWFKLVTVGEGVVGNSSRVTGDNPTSPEDLLGNSAICGLFVDKPNKRQGMAASVLREACIV